MVDTSQKLPLPQFGSYRQARHAIQPLHGYQLNLRPKPGHYFDGKYSHLNGFYKNEAKFDGSQQLFQN